MLDAALAYAARGWAVFPLQPQGKDPLDGSRGFKDATTDAAKIRKWWGRFPDMNIGMATGAASGGVVAVDVDENDEKGKHGMDTLTAWEGERGALPETPMSITGSGGYHILLHVDGPCPCSTNGDKDVDIRGDGGYIVLPPSVHPTGNRYEWELDPDEVPVADADENALAFIGSVRPSHFGEWSEFEVPESIPEGERDEQIFRLASSLRAKGMDAKLMEVICLEVNRDRCVPPLSDAKVRAKVRSAMRYRPGRSDEFEAKAKAAAEKPEKKQRPKKFEHNKVARRLMDESRFCFVDGMPAVFSGGRWRVGWNAVDAEIIRMHDDCTIHDRREVKAYLGARGGRRKQSPCELVAFENGVLDIRTMELREYREDDVIPNVIPHRWNPDAEYPLLDATLERMARGDGCVLADMQQVIGMCMARTASRLAVCPVLMGGGSNGKSTFIRLLQRTVGAENISAMQPDELPQRFQMLNLLGKTANLGDDIKGGYLDMKECKTIKSVSTGDIVTSDVKGNDTVTFSPYATMVFSCNAFPRLADTTDGMMRRFFPIPFTARFDRSDPDFDPAIGEKLDTEECLERACVMGIEGLRLVLADGMVPNEQSEAILASIRTDSSTVLQWLEDRGLGGGGLVGWTKAQAYADYSDWCDANGSRNTKMTSATMSAQLRTFERLELTGYADGTGHASGKRVRVYRQMP
jgi:P4 family phage/plasmid primase-like protien